ncbi:Glutathione S-transferase 1 [Madurella mycetomatis]|uniref:Glutathione S-transferase 1 n=1 Tax=Madurella mycetomatis TaxID=100816 RepID=A0A175W382_9PEZI|nr:Glutathione S-transferase 1 [Madurella mycetomatis]
MSRGPCTAPSELKKLHPLGKSPVVSITPHGASEPIVLAESGFIVQYLCDHFPKGKALVPRRWKDGQEGQLGGEAEEWMCYQYLLHYIEGSFMFTMVLSFILSGMQGPNLSGAGIMLGYPLIAGKGGTFAMGAWAKGPFKETSPKLHAYIERLSEEAGWKRSVRKIEEVEGSFSILPTTKL